MIAAAEGCATFVTSVGIDRVPLEDRYAHVCTSHVTVRGVEMSEEIVVYSFFVDFV